MLYHKSAIVSNVKVLIPLAGAKSYTVTLDRTIQEEFINPNLDTIHDKGVFWKQLNEYLIYYNTERPHHSLGLKTPLEYYREKGGMSQMYLTYTRS